MFDDVRRLDVGEAVGICLPAAALHMYPGESSAAAADIADRAVGPSP